MISVGGEDAAAVAEVSVGLAAAAVEALFPAPDARHAGREGGFGHEDDVDDGSFLITVPDVDVPGREAVVLHVLGRGGERSRCMSSLSASLSRSRAANAVPSRRNDWARLCSRL